MNLVPVPRVSAVELQALLDGGGASRLFLIDTRSRKDYEAGHVPGALHCPVHELSRRERDLPPRTSRVIVVGEPGRRGEAGGVFLVLAGFAFVAMLDGGWPAWTGPVEVGPGNALDAWRPAKPKGWVDPPAG